MSESYISRKTGKPYYGAAAQNHLIYTIHGGIDKYNEKVGKKYLSNSLLAFAFCIAISRPMVHAIKTIVKKQ